MKKLNIIDMFCGGGGESTGLIEAAHEYNFDVNISAINHWERALETHAANYPFAVAAFVFLFLIADVREESNV